MSNKKEKDLSELTKELDKCKLMIKKSQERKNKIYSMIDASSDSIYLVDRDYRYLFINNEVMSRLGLPREQVLGKTFSDLHSPDESAEFAKIIDQVFKTGKSIRKEHMSKKLNKWFIRTVNPVKNKNCKTGKMISAVVVSKDITELKKAEEDLKKTHQELKETTAMLVHTEKMIALGELTAGIAHELNQPLNNVKIISQELLRDINRERLDVDTLPEDLKDLVGQVNKMAKIIDHMRIFTRRLDGFCKEEININQPINNMFMLSGEHLRVHNINVVKDLANGLPKVLGDSTALEQVLTNIMVNARKAVEEFRKTGRAIEIKSFMNNESEVNVSIKDNGGGVPLNIRDRIFEPFFTNKPVGQGVGLGLSIAKKIMEEHNGRIELEVEEEKGSTFTLILPVATENKRGRN